jgi:hypothetical protein
MNQAPVLTPEEFEAAFELVRSRHELWNQTGSHAGYDLVVNEASRLAGELPRERIQEILNAVSSALDTELTADLEYGRQMRRYLWTGDREGYAHFMHATYSARIPALVEWALQSLRMPIIANEPEKGPRWIQ